MEPTEIVQGPLDADPPVVRARSEPAAGAA